MFAVAISASASSSLSASTSTSLYPSYVCEHVKSNKFNNAYTYGIKTNRMKLRIRHVVRLATKTVRIWCPCCLAGGRSLVLGPGSFLPSDFYKDAHQRTAVERRLITMQINAAYAQCLFAIAFCSPHFYLTYKVYYTLAYHFALVSVLVCGSVRVNTLYTLKHS